VSEIVKKPSDISEGLKNPEIPKTPDSSEAIKQSVNNELMPRVPPFPMTRQMRRKLQRQGIKLPDNPMQV
ncbi:MAG: hypothetical protein K2G09_00190, partial [Paramuribaculum sp.]|nr:hypothetical protein [Paramuribaculum sp.]